MSKLSIFNETETAGNKYSLEYLLLAVTQQFAGMTHCEHCLVMLTSIVQLHILLAKF